MKIEIENKTIEFNVQYGNRKKISIHIDSFGFITVKAPKDTSKEIIISAVEHHGKWILEKIHDIGELEKPLRQESIKIKGSSYILGKSIFFMS